MGLLRTPAGLLCALPKQTKSTNPNWILTTLWIIEAFVFKINKFHPILWPQQQPFFENLNFPAKKYLFISSNGSVDCQWGPATLYSKQPFKKEIRRRKQRIKSKALEKQNKVVDLRDLEEHYFSMLLCNQLLIYSPKIKHVQFFRIHTIILLDLTLKESTLLV